MSDRSPEQNLWIGVIQLTINDFEESIRMFKRSALRSGDTSYHRVFNIRNQIKNDWFYQITSFVDLHNSHFVSYCEKNIAMLDRWCERNRPAIDKARAEYLNVKSAREIRDKIERLKKKVPHRL